MGSECPGIWARRLAGSVSRSATVIHPIKNRNGEKSAWEFDMTQARHASDLFVLRCASSESGRRDGGELFSCDNGSPSATIWIILLNSSSKKISLPEITSRFCNDSSRIRFFLIYRAVPDSANKDVLPSGWVPISKIFATFFSYHLRIGQHSEDISSNPMAIWSVFPMAESVIYQISSRTNCKG